MIREKYNYYIELAGFAAIAIICIFFTKNGFVYDEPYYLSNVALIKEVGISDQYLVNLKGPAGPTYSVLHYILSPITQLKVPLVRAVNVLLFAGSIFFINRFFKQIKARQIAWIGIAIPMAIVCVGMALTEMPAIFFLCVSIWLFNKTSRFDVITKILSGLFFSFAILGRQPLLLTIPVFIYLNGFNRKAIIGSLCFLLFALALPAYCFSVWKGLIPATGNIAEEGELVINHFLLALGYTLICFLIISPAFIRLPFKINPLVMVVSVIVAFGISYFANLKFSLLNTLAKKILPASILEYYPYLCFSVLMVAGLYMAFVFIYRYFQHKDDRIFVFALASCFLLLISTLAVKHQFSSRYVFQAFPFMLVLAEKYVKFSTGYNLLRVGGILVGIASLLTYLF